MGEKELSEYKLSELRELFPHVKANSKASFIAQINEYEDVEEELGEEYDDESFAPEQIANGEVVSTVRAIEGAVAEAGDFSKILFVSENSFEADDFYVQLVGNLVELAEVDNISVMSRDGMREIHFGGRTFFRCVCKNREAHAKSTRIYSKTVYIK